MLRYRNTGDQQKGTALLVGGVVGQLEGFEISRRPPFGLGLRDFWTSAVVQFVESLGVVGSRFGHLEAQGT